VTCRPKCARGRDTGRPTPKTVHVREPPGIGSGAAPRLRGAFAGSLVQRSNVPLLLWHDNRSFAIGHAVAWDDRYDGLWGEFVLAMTPVAQVAGQHAADDDLSGISVGFTPIRSTWKYAADWNADLGPDYMDHVVAMRPGYMRFRLRRRPPIPRHGSTRLSRTASLPNRSSSNAWRPV